MSPASQPLAPPAPAAARLSGAISVARVLCILGAVYVHAWTGWGGADLAAFDATPQGLLRWGLIEILGRSAVPLLGVISGWLAFSGVRKRTWAEFTLGKAKTLIAPMVLWNAIGIAIVCAGASWGVLQGPTPRSLWWTINELLCLSTPGDINVQMPFLRDLFVCMIAAPFLARAPKRVLAAIAIGALIWSVTGWVFPLLLRPSILFFFVLGMIVRASNLAERIAAQPLSTTAAVYAALALAKVWSETAGDAYVTPLFAAGLDLALRLGAAWFFWTASWRLATRKEGALLMRMEQYVFLLFCAHLIMIWVGGPLIGNFTGPLGAPLYPLFLLAQPPLTLLGARALGEALEKISPRAAKLLSGGRLGSPPRAANALPNAAAS